MLVRDFQLRRQADMVVIEQNDLYYSLQAALITTDNEILVNRALILTAYCKYKRKLAYLQLFNCAAGCQSLQITRRFITHLLKENQNEENRQT